MPKDEQETNPAPKEVKEAPVVKAKGKLGLPALPRPGRSMSVTSEDQGSEASLPPATPSTTSATPKAAGGKFLDHEAPAAVQGGPDFAQPPIKKKQGVKRKADTTT